MQKASLQSFTEKERRLIEQIVAVFYEHYNGYDNRAVSPDIVASLEGRGHKISEAAFRRYLGFIRFNDSCRKYVKKYQGRLDFAFIVSSTTGYWWSEDHNELKTFWESQHGRVCEIMSNAKPLYKLFGFGEDQLKLIFDNDKREIA